MQLDDVTTQELAARLGEEGLVLLDVRSPGEFDGTGGYPCDPRQGHIPGARNLDVGVLVGMTAEQIRAWVGLVEGAEVIAYCHSGGRSAHAVAELRGAGYAARNYVGSWHAWAADASLPLEA